MKHYSDDDLERALFNLPLEAAPADLRASILARTVYHHALPVKAWEAWLIGGSAAMIAWLLVLILRDGTGPVLATINAIGAFVLSVFSQPATILWTAVGIAAAVWMMLLTPRLAPRTVRD